MTKTQVKEDLEKIDKILPHQNNEAEHIVLNKGDEIKIEKENISIVNVEISHLQNQLIKAYVSIDKLILRIAELESSKFYKLKKLLSFYYKRLFKNFKTKEKKGFISIFYNYIFKRGAKVTRILLAKILKHIYLLVETKKVMIVEVFTAMLANTAEYSEYLKRKQINKSKRKYIINNILSFEYKPILSIVMPVYDPPIDFFTQALDSITNQIYPYWEICIADDCSKDEEVIEVIEKYRQKYENIKVVYRNENGHISRASNSALELVKGSYTVLMDQDDILREDALYEIALAINKNPSVDLIYSDEDKIDENGIHSTPYFKPDWSPDNLLSRNYINHITAFKTSQLKAIGGWRVGFEGSQDYDLLLRYTEVYTNIHHIPEVLYHWKIHRESAASNEIAKPYAHRNALLALTEAMERRGYEANFDFLNGFRGFSMRLKIKNPTVLVSIIIPTKNQHSYLRKCIDSIVNLSTYVNYEIILIDNKSDEKSFFNLVELYKKQTRFAFKYVRDDKPFNFSRLMNLGRKHSEGEYLILLNNDTEIITPDWIEAYLEHCQRPEIGVAGCKLLFSDETIQHAGVVIGLGGVAGHALIRESRYGPGYFNYINLLSNYSALTAACIMVRKEVFDKVKGFSEEFAVEYNDVDFCLKVIEAGFRNIYIPHIELFHHESITRGHPHSTDESYKRHVFEVSSFRKKWMKYVENDPCYNNNLTLNTESFAIKI
ncbi:MAG: glycosyltransferase family 2 protein [Bacteroidota bacterium]